ncbi:hypothetical protein [Streptomyces melanogenes]|uniref:hypothetical protein n=1 Tax=Streptomyces melanogenes TaxID=67326 RepID=UPI00167E83B1|nr:hypothetical protein [Streptomyces melanogenes]
MSVNRTAGQSPLGLLARGAEAIIPPFPGRETYCGDDLTVTAGGSLFLAVLVLPIIVIAGMPGGWSVPLATVFVTAAARRTYVSYRRVRLN